jgi:hypothetical protein
MAGCSKESNLDPVIGDGLIIDHTTVKLATIPSEWIAAAKENLHIAVRGGMIKIGKVRVDKGEKIGPIEFAQSVNLKVGDRLGT